MKFKKLHAILLPSLLGLTYISMSSYSGGLSGRTTTGCSCHGAANTNTVVSVTGPSGYSNGQVITFTINVSNATLAAAGFDLRCNIGQITNVSAGITKFSNTEIIQSSPKAITSGTASWTFEWTAPATGNTALQFYVVGNAVNLNGSTSGDAWNFATVPSIPLPINFKSFNVVNETHSVKGVWEMADQQNTDHFEVEKSIDGLTFALLYKMDVENDATNGHYQFEDKLVTANQTYFYRIKEVLKDGTSGYTHVQSVGFKGAENGILLYPNVLSGNLLYNKGINFPGHQYTFQLISLSGKTLYQAALKESNIQLPDNLASGSYITRILADKKVVYSGFIFKR